MLDCFYVQEGLQPSFYCAKDCFQSGVPICTGEKEVTMVNLIGLDHSFLFPLA